MILEWEMGGLVLLGHYLQILVVLLYPDMYYRLVTTFIPRTFPFLIVTIPTLEISSQKPGPKMSMSGTSSGPDNFH